MDLSIYGPRVVHLKPVRKKEFCSSHSKAFQLAFQNVLPDLPALSRRSWLSSSACWIQVHSKPCGSAQWAHLSLWELSSLPSSWTNWREVPEESVQLSLFGLQVCPHGTVLGKVVTKGLLWTTGQTPWHHTSSSQCGWSNPQRTLGSRVRAVQCSFPQQVGVNKWTTGRRQNQALLRGMEHMSPSTRAHCQKIQANLRELYSTRRLLQKHMSEADTTKTSQVLQYHAKIERCKHFLSITESESLSPRSKRTRRSSGHCS